MGKYAGMTVNERLYISGLMDKFDEAIQDKDTETAILILRNIELSDESIKDILENFGAITSF